MSGLGATGLESTESLACSFRLLSGSEYKYEMSETDYILPRFPSSLYTKNKFYPFSCIGVLYYIRLVFLNCKDVFEIFCQIR